MRFIYLVFVLFIILPAMAQNKGDSKIIITLLDTSGVYERVKLALVKADFIVKELNNRDTITTYQRELKSMSGVVVADAVIKDGKVELIGFYTLKKLNYFGHTRLGKDFKPIIYYKSGKLWPLLMKVAREIGGKFEYSEQ